VMEAVVTILRTPNDEPNASVPEHQRLLQDWDKTVADLTYIGKQVAGIPDARDGWYRARGLCAPDASTLEKVGVLFGAHGEAKVN
jgi:hypothetical protein